MGLDMYFSQKKTKEGITHYEAEAVIELFGKMNLLNRNLPYALGDAEEDWEKELVQQEYDNDVQELLKEVPTINKTALTNEELIECLMDSDFVESDKEYDLVYDIYDYEFGYWRKANHIHKWFVDNVQNSDDDQEEYEVSLEKLRELKAICDKVLWYHKSAPELLPTSSGFCFGDTSYDDYYFNSVKYTKSVIEEAIKELENDDSPRHKFFYSSWW